MEPDYKEPRERMEQASLKELMPGFDKEGEWHELSARLKQSGRWNIRFTWLRAAAAILLLAGGGWLAVSLAGGNKEQAVAENQFQLPIAGRLKDTGIVQGGLNSNDTGGEPAHGETTISADGKVLADVSADTVTQGNAADIQQPATPGKKYASSGNTRKESGNNNAERFFNYYVANGNVCNGTSCPLEICIVQTFKCGNAKPSAIATCNTLGPAESGQLRYKALDKKDKGCKVTIDEIRIKRLSTGETIVLNSRSKPATAEELFSCITSQEKCNILAGIFDADCNNHCNRDNLIIYNNDGKLTLQ